MGHLIEFLPHGQGETLVPFHTGGVIIRKTGDDGEPPFGEGKDFTYGVFLGSPSQPVAAPFSPKSLQELVTNEYLQDDFQIFFGDALTVGDLLQGGEAFFCS